MLIHPQALSTQPLTFGALPALAPLFHWLILIYLPFTYLMERALPAMMPDCPCPRDARGAAEPVHPPVHPPLVMAPCAG